MMNIRLSRIFLLRIERILAHQILTLKHTAIRHILRDQIISAHGKTSTSHTEPPFPRRGLLWLLFSNRSSIRDKYIILENNYLIIIPFNLRFNGILLIRRSISRHNLRLRNRPILCILYILPERCHPSLRSHFNRSRCRNCLHDRSRNSR